MRRAVAGALQLALVGCIVGGLAMPVLYFAGYSKGESAATSERNDHWQGVITKLEEDQRRTFEQARAETERRTAAITKERDDAQTRLNQESAKVRALRGDLVRAGREHDQLRDQLAAAAAGGVAADQDSVAACRERADALGRVLGEALRTSSACAVDTEDLAAGNRALQAGWPEVTP